MANKEPTATKRGPGRKPNHKPRAAGSKLARKARKMTIGGARK